MGVFCHTQVECILNSSEEVDDFLTTLEDLVTSVDPVSLSDWNTFTIYDLEQDANKIRWTSSGYGWYKNLLENLAEKFPESKFAQIWLPVDTSYYGNWGMDIYDDGQEQISIKLYTEDLTDDPEEIGFAIVHSNFETPQEYSALYEVIHLAINKGFDFPKAADFNLDVVEPETTEIVTFETLSDISTFFEDGLESGFDYDTCKVEIEFRVLAVLAEASSEREGFEFPVERFIAFKGERWQPWSPINYNIPVSHLTLLEEKFPGKDRIQLVKYDERGTMLTLFYDKAQKGTGIIYSGGLHVATYNHETSGFWFV